MPMEPALIAGRYTYAFNLGEDDVHLVLSGLVVAILIAAIAWTFAQPYVTHWRATRAAERRRIAERRKP
jgi:hypothetical protein